MLPQDHADAHQVQTGTELSVSLVSEEDNGMLPTDSVSVLMETGMVSLVLLVPLVKVGI